MTHAESQDLLLDLAYGELDPVRARELEGHLAGCEECQREKAALDEARRLTAPLREVEEPSHGFDEKILAAARAQAQMDHGTVGEVIEVSGNVKPLGLEPARIDPHAPVSARQERRKPRWAMRLVLGGSVAAAATLALVISTTLQTRHAQELARTAASDADAYKIRVQPASEAPQHQPPPPAAVAQNEALRDAQRAPTQVVQLAPPPAKHARKKADTAVDLGSGGDALDQSRGAGAVAGAVAAPAPVAEAKPASPPPEKDVAAAENVVKEEPAPAAVPEQRRTVAERIPMVATASKGVAAGTSTPPAAARALPSGDDYRAALKLEADAQVARHGGKYADAAAMYRQAAGLRRSAGDRSDAAWDLAHAVECFAAVGMFEDGFRARDELVNTYPSEVTAISAAKRALREVDSVPAAKQ